MDTKVLIITDSMREELAAAGIENAWVRRVRRDEMGLPDLLIEGQGTHDTELYRGWWMEGEAADDIEFLAEAADWPEDVAVEQIALSRTTAGDQLLGEGVALAELKSRIRIAECARREYADGQLFLDIAVSVDGGEFKADGRYLA